MSPIPDPHELRAVADRIGRHADAVRQVHDGLAARVRRLHWHGHAASAFVWQACVVLASLASAAGRLDDAADALRRLAARVEAVLADLRRLVRDGSHILADAGGVVRDLVSDPGSVPGDLAGLAGDVGSGAADVIDAGLDIVGLG